MSISPLDLILFRGVDKISETILLCEKIAEKNDKYSHIGIVINSEVLPMIPELKAGVLYIWESTVADKTDPPDVETHKPRHGVQIRPLTDVILSYADSERDCEIDLGVLKDNPWKLPENRPMIIHAFDEIHKKIGHRTYEYSPLNLLAAAFTYFRTPRDIVDTLIIDTYEILNMMGYKGKRDTKKDIPSTPPVPPVPPNVPIAGWFFCSELVALLYKSINVLPPTVNPENITPVDLLGCQPRDCPNVIEKIVSIIHKK